MKTNTPRTAATRLALLATVLFGFAGQHAGTVLAATPLSGAPAPDFVLKSLSGENVRLSEYRGQVVMVSFWATWCGDCRTQLEGLNDWYGTYQGAGLQLLAVSLDRSWEVFSKTAATLNLAYPVLYDANLEVGKLYDVSSMPVAVLIDRDGVVRDVIEGYRRTGEQEFLDRVRALLREQW
ncbi:MAG: TlpA family protein disulfide reductase [Gammaproteobacteria bacterium]|nr:TlpA family protein disulfide reductase [Gammaproteobacteria bacterium]MDH3506004.1 TlpA family protein disulfide reductase [Gammaproteobacteria bacterium]